MFEKFHSGNKFVENEPVLEQDLLSNYESSLNEKVDAENLLEPNVVEINLPNLNVQDLIVIDEVLGMRENILTRSYQMSLDFKKKLDIFIEEIGTAYSEEELKKTALYHILIGTDIPDDVEELDLEGDYSIKSFLQEFLNQLEEGRI